METGSFFGRGFLESWTHLCRFGLDASLLGLLGIGGEDCSFNRFCAYLCLAFSCSLLLGLEMSLVYTFGFFFQAVWAVGWPSLVTEPLLEGTTAGRYGADMLSPCSEVCGKRGFEGGRTSEWKSSPF